MEGDVQLIKDIMPSLSTPEIRRVLRQTGDLGAAVKHLLHPTSPVIHRNRGSEKRVIVSVNRDCGDQVVSAVEAAMTSVRSSEVVVSSIAPQNTISVSFQGNPCKPMIYVEPEPLDSQFLKNIEEKSLILTERYDQMDTKMLCSFFGIVLLPLSKDIVTCAVRRVLIENGIVGEGFGVRKYGDLWCEMLKEIPSINGIYADSISQQVPTPYHIATKRLDSLTTRNGNKLPQRVIDTVSLFYTTDDPAAPLDTRNVRHK